MRRQFDLFLCAVQFLTRLPTPPLTGFQPDWIGLSARYFPLVGQLVGLICAGVLLEAAQLWNGWLACLIAVAVGVLITGAFHEDGLADTADGLGGGQTPAQRLEIMKDSRIGTYGALALGLTVALKVAALAQLSPWLAAACLLAAHGLGRAAAVVAMGALPYAGDPAGSKGQAVAVVSRASVVIAIILSLWPLALLPLPAALFCIAGGAVPAVLMALTARRLIGGQTGDVLGAIEQAFELGFLLTAAAVLTR